MDDRKLILDLGGPAKVAALLGLNKAKGGVQRVHNWMARGIPPKEKLRRPDLFLPNFGPSAGPPQSQSPAVRLIGTIVEEKKQENHQ